MKSENETQQEAQKDLQDDRKEFVEPELERHGTLPDMTGYSFPA